MPVFRLFGTTRAAPSRRGRALLHLEVDPHEVGKVHEPAVGLVGDVRLGARRAARAPGPGPGPEARERRDRAAAETAAARAAARARVEAGGASASGWAPPPSPGRSRALWSATTW